MTEFSKAVISVIRKVPKGKVATYGQIAKLAGKPHAARAVSWILHSSSLAQKLPWQRILNAKGQIAFPRDSRLFQRQSRLLRKEGVRFLDDNQVDLKICLWKPSKALFGSKMKTPHQRVRSSIAD